MTEDANELTDRQLLLGIHKSINAHTETHKDIELRLKSLEATRSYATGATAVIASSWFAYVKGWFGLGGTR